MNLKATDLYYYGKERLQLNEKTIATILDNEKQLLNGRASYRISFLLMKMKRSIWVVWKVG
jgi:hypothetical protein